MKRKLHKNSLFIFFLVSRVFDIYPLIYFLMLDKDREEKEECEQGEGLGHGDMVAYLYVEKFLYLEHH